MLAPTKTRKPTVRTPVVETACEVDATTWLVRGKTNAHRVYLTTVVYAQGIGYTGSCSCAGGRSLQDLPALERGQGCHHLRKRYAEITEEEER